jgi:2-polyprenyl-3-methyl-5-hydroxy-6-metoxy-1,4-benzoquinol methylase
MSRKKITQFHKPTNHNDLTIVENIVYPIFAKQTMKDKHHWNAIRSLFLSTMKQAQLNFFKRHIFWLYVNRTITRGLKQGVPLIEVEDTLRQFLRNRVDKDKDLKTIARERAKRSCNLVAPYLVGNTILDLGAGDGLLAFEIHKQLQKNVVLVDIVDYNDTDLPLIVYHPNDQIPLADQEIDTTILYTVLHHASNPEHVLKEATRITKTRLVIVEGYIEEEKKRMTNIFFDWFYNRVIGDEDINVPLNFLSVNGWKHILKSLGFDITEHIYLGINEPMVPEYQVLLIADNA